MNPQTTTRDVYSIVTDRIIMQLEKGTIPWHQPWTKAGLPINLVTKTMYRGLNFLYLSSLGYEQNYFLTFKQLKEMGASITKGEHGHMVVFWKKIEIENMDSKEKQVAYFIRYHTVFNVAQCTGIPNEKIPVERRENNSIATCDNIIRSMQNKPDIIHGRHEAYYDIVQDYINMPIIESFDDSDYYYSTLFHELIHSTGSADRLNRPGIVKADRYGSDTYSFEELIAEIGACFLNAHAGIEKIHFDNSAGYINNWLKRLKSDKKLIISASSEAQKAVDYILNVNTETEAVIGKEEILTESEVTS